MRLRMRAGVDVIAFLEELRRKLNTMEICERHFN
jgi:hypothetical protein